MTKSIFVTLVVLQLAATAYGQDDARFVTYEAEPAAISLYWKDDNGTIFRSIQNLKLFLEKDSLELKFAMNGGMYKSDYSPQGLFIENGSEQTPLDTLSGSGNFYLKPNGIFYVTNDNISAISKTEDFINTRNIRFATQSGPLLLINGNVHPAFKKGSANLNIRNGVGILPNGRVVFIISRVQVNFYDFAEYFKSLGCKDALYLDGFVSRAYIPTKNWNQLDGNFGVIIGVAK